jgi:hypothetical protein
MKPLWIGVVCSLFFQPDPAFVRSATIRLYNSTPCVDSGLVEVPVGSLATPGEIDWSHARLMHDGHEVPFAIREGRPHWKALFTAPIVQPRAEDLLVFGCAIPPGVWMELEVAPDRERQHSVLSRDGGRFVVSYPNLRVVIEEATGRLTELTAHHDSMLKEAMSIDSFKLQGGERPVERPLTPRVTLASSSSSEAMTEINFLLALSDVCQIGLTYRIHAFGLVEILGDERPWQGTSPWIDHRVKYAVKLMGEQQTLPYMLNWAPAFGFSDYNASVKFVATIHRASRAAAVEIGEETVNGRRWNRRLYFLPAENSQRAEHIAELADKGFVVETRPVCEALHNRHVVVIHGVEGKAAADILVQSLGRAGIAARDAKEAVSGEFPLQLQLSDDSQMPTISGDGFCVQRRLRGEGVRVTGRTRFGLTQAAVRIAEHLKAKSKETGIPLIASNPAADLRAGGFGGTSHEVDFPYGSEAEWREVLNNMADGGMNVMTALGMWSNWKMPIAYKYFPELRADPAKGYDEVSGAPFNESEGYRERALRLMDFLHRRGVKVWLWAPIGAVPTTYAECYPDAMSALDKRAPCYTHPKYRRFLDAFLRELLETYPIDGLVMIRDDNGGICRCARCEAYVANSPTHDAAWQQYLVLHERLRSMGFKGDIAVYPYYDLYRPSLDPLLPEDMIVVGHGSGAGVLVRQYGRLGPMGDTWLDNVFANFRPPTAARMKRLLADRGSFWIGGAYEAQELPWEAAGYFGWTPTNTVSSFRYQWGVREFGEQDALKYLDLTDAYERLWDLYNLPLLPENWVKLTAAEQDRVAEQGRLQNAVLRQRLAALRGGGAPKKGTWFRHVELYSDYFDYVLRRMEIFSQMLALVRQHREILTAAQRLNEEDRRQLVAMQKEACRLAADYDREAVRAPGMMIAATRNAGLTRLFVTDFTSSFARADSALDIKQFAGSIALTADQMVAGKSFVLRVHLRNKGVYAWQPEPGQRLQLRLSGDAGRLGLPTQWDYAGEWTVFGDQRELELRGVVPQLAGKAIVTATLVSPFGLGIPVAQQTIKVQWE